MTITGVAAADFRIITQPAPSLLPGESTTFVVRFNPDTAGVKRATLVLRSNDSENASFDFDIRGNAVAKPIVQLSGNPALEKLIDQLSISLYRFQFRSRLTAERLKRGHDDHVEVARAILAGDPGSAERFMRKHLRNSAKLILSLPDDAFGLTP